MRSSLWLVPAVFVLLSIVLAVALTELDRRVEDVGQVRFIFGGSAEAGRTVLSTISGSMVTLTALVFSILIVVFQLTSSQFTPRALRTFLQDRPSKIALGAFLGAFAFSLTVLRSVRSADGAVEEFVPRLSITAAFLVSILTMAVFVYYIHHVSLSIRVSSILTRIHEEAIAVIGRLPDESDKGRGEEQGRVETRRVETGRQEPERAQEPKIIRSRKAGYITSIRSGELVQEAIQGDFTVRVSHEVGTFVACGRPLLEVFAASEGQEVNEGLLLSKVHLAGERTTEQDLGYGFRQLADIAVRALSPGVNDPTTARMAIDRIEDLLLRTGRRPLQDDLRFDDQGRLRIQVPRQSWETLVREALRETIHYGKNSPQVADRLRDLVAVLREELDTERIWTVDQEAEREGLSLLVLPSIAPPTVETSDERRRALG